MIYNYLKLGFRNLFKQKTYSLINIVGLSVGIAAFLMILATCFATFLPSSFFTDLMIFSIFLFSIAFSIAFSFNKIHQYYLTFKENFKKISELKVLIIVFTLVFQLLLFKWFKIRGLIFGSLISIILVSIYYFILNKPLFTSISLPLLRKTLKLQCHPY